MIKKLKLYNKKKIDFYFILFIIYLKTESKKKLI